VKLIIKRKRWLRGKPDNSALRNADGKQCCLGFLARACGATTKDILGLPDPGATTGIAWPKGISPGGRGYDGYGNTALVGRIISTNDSRGLLPEARERQLKELFAEAGVEVVFE